MKKLFNFIEERIKMEYFCWRQPITKNFDVNPVLALFKILAKILKEEKV